MDSYLPRLNDKFLFIIDKMISDAKLLSGIAIPGIGNNTSVTSKNSYEYQWDPGNFRHREMLVLRIIFLVKLHF